ncbi:MAG TPA: DUF4412 domain-containing protein [Polyangiaceae bacterium]|nr:DUF4412 domain-containing protein [Polyangiaceae bacterium]
MGYTVRMGPHWIRACAFVAVVVSLSHCSKKQSPAGAGSGEGTSAPAAGGLGLGFLNGFEGEIGIAVKDATKGSKPVPPLALMVKDSKLRIELPAEMTATSGMPGKGYAVLDTPEKKLYAVLEDKKQVVVIDLDRAGEHIKAFGSGVEPGEREPRKEGPSRPPPKVTKTGRKDTVAGYSCEIWDIVPETGEKLSACVANEGASWFRLPLTGIPTEHAWALELLDGKHFPLRGIAYDKAGAEKARFEVTKIDKKTLAATLFDIPQGYKVVDLQQMFMALGAMGGAPMLGKMPPGLPPGMMPPQMGVPPRGAPPTPKRP